MAHWGRIPGGWWFNFKKAVRLLGCTLFPLYPFYFLFFPYLPTGVNDDELSRCTEERGPAEGCAIAQELI